ERSFKHRVEKHCTTRAEKDEQRENIIPVSGGIEDKECGYCLQVKYEGQVLQEHLAQFHHRKLTGQQATDLIYMHRLRFTEHGPRERVDRRANDIPDNNRQDEGIEDIYLEERVEEIRDG